MNDKRVLAHWRVFCRETNKIKNISPELKNALTRADNIRISFINKERGNNEKL
jgi:hypothetical protein